MGLKRYHSKRDFKQTSEPRGTVQPRKNGHSYLIQKHAARRLHYDFRLELNGVLVSWAVPKGPSLDPKEKRLAVHVEDHPVEYSRFEGVIPAGEYGGGSVLLWDRGEWIPEGDPVDGLRKGKLKFTLRGEKLKGGWTLVRMGGRAAGESKENWLLIKENDQEAAPLKERDILKERPESIATGRSMEEIASARDREWTSSGELKKENKPAPRAARTRTKSAQTSPDVSRLTGARKAELPRQIEPELATLVDQVPEGDDWIHEIKFDGYRALCRIEGGRAVFQTRRGQDWTARFRTLAESAQALPLREALLDGEVVILEPDGTTNFQSLQNALSGGKDDRLIYFAFDLLHLNGYDLTQVPLLTRKQTLAVILQSSNGANQVRFSDHVVGNGKVLLRKACQLSLEGVISKRADRPYRPGRGQDWLKTKCLQSQEFVIGAFTEPAGARAGLGALLLGVYDERGDLTYAGRVGTGFTHESLRELRARLDALEQKSSPFSDSPSGAAARNVHWIKPSLVAEVEFTGWTNDNRLRHPSFKGLREDKAAQEVVREKALPAKTKQNPAKSPKSPKSPKLGERVAVAGVTLSNPERVLFPADGITKRELALYYEEMAEWILPHLAGRLLTLVRCPEGYEGECFFQKNATESLAQEIRRVPIPDEKETKSYLAVDSLEGLISLVQMGVLELHTWGSRTDQIERPDRMIFDLDPDPSVSWDQVVQAAREVRARLIDLGLGAFVKTTGGKGLHIVVPLMRKHDWNEVKEFSRAIAESFARDHPARYTATASKAKRKGKIFVDYLRNSRGATAVAAYSTRARATAPVSAPLRWEELSAELRSDEFTLRNLARRIARLRGDPWDGYDDARRSLSKTMQRKLK